MTERAN